MSPEAPREPGGAFVDAALPADELTQKLGIRLVHRRIRIRRDHLLLVRLSAFAGSAVQRMTAANGSLQAPGSSRIKHKPDELGRFPFPPLPTTPPGHTRSSVQSANTLAFRYFGALTGADRSSVATAVGPVRSCCAFVLIHLALLFI
jgi:hypothetical protein